MKSFGLSLTLAAAAAVSGAGCDAPEPAEWSASAPTRLCRDGVGRRAPDDRCDSRARGHRFYYIGQGVVIPALGQVLRGGGDRPVAGVSYGRAAGFTARAPAGAVARGGFGASARGGVGG